VNRLVTLVLNVLAEITLFAAVLDDDAKSEHGSPPSRSGAVPTSKRSNSCPLRFARTHPYVPGMDDAKFWKQALKEAERELEAAIRLADLNAAAKKLMLAKGQLKRLEAAGN
jgi:hypothetical protein